MALGLWRRIGLAVPALAAHIQAQVSGTPAAPSFTPILPGGQFVDERMSPLFMIGFAYSVENRMPGCWLRRIGRPLPVMRAMLADHFQLQLHTETRQQAILNLVLAKDGIRIGEVDPPAPPEKEGHQRCGWRASKATIAGPANGTELKGYYDFNVRWSAPEPPDGQPPIRD